MAPDASSACTAKYESFLVTWIVVSKPCFGTVVTGTRCARSGPASTCHEATSVAPFQLAYTVVAPS